MSQYGEPWAVYTAANERSTTHGIHASNGRAAIPSLAVKQELMERIVAAVNACRGIPTEILKRAKAHVMLNDDRLFIGASVEDLPEVMRKCLEEMQPKPDLSCEARDY